MNLTIQPGTENMSSLDDGETMYVFAGFGLSDSDIREAVIELEDASVGGLEGYWLEVDEGTWGWSPRFMHCDRHDTGFSCDNAGEWHRHYSPNYGHDRVSVVTLHSFDPQYQSGDRRVFPVVTA